MRGEVEIWDGDKLLHKESNLLVNGAGELLADIMTVSPSLSGIADHATSSILDSSNYTIQAISFGKDASAYQYNAHKYGDRRNLWYDSTFSSVAPTSESGGRTVTAGAGNGIHYLLSSIPEEPNPPGFEDIPSSTAHVTFLADLSALDDGGTGGNVRFNYPLNFNSANDWTTGPNAVSALQDKWFCASVYIKTPAAGYPFNLNLIDGTLSPLQAQTDFKNSITAPGTAATDPAYSVGRARNSVTLYWDPTTEPHTPSGITVASFHSDPRTVAAGFTEDLWNANGGVQDVGNGWYRVWNAVPAPSGGDYFVTTIGPAGWDAGDNYGETSGGMFTFGWQVEVGKWPTPLQINSGYQANGWDLSGSVLNQWYAKYGSEAAHPLDKGTVRVLNDPIPNPNLLFYTDDPWSSPGLGTGDETGIYWEGTQLADQGFSSINVTNPFGGTSAIAVSGAASPAAYTYISAKQVSAVEATGGTTGGRGIYLKEGYNTIFSMYVKKPDSGALTTSSFILMIHDIQLPDAHTNNITCEYLGGGNVPTIKGTPTAALSNSTVEDAGNGWYRISNCLSGLGAGAAGNTVDGDMAQVRFYLGDYSDPISTNESLWAYAPQVEQWPIGTKNIPTKYRAVSGNVPTYAEDNLLTSSYTPTNYLSSPPNPESTRVEDRNTTAETFSGIFSAIDFGQNLNMVPWRDYSSIGTQLRTPTSFSGYSIIDVAHPKTIYVKDYAWPFAGNSRSNYEGSDDLYTSGVGTLGTQAYYLGCYPEGSSTGGSNWAMVSSLDTSAAYPINYAPSSDPNFVSGTYNSIVNEASSMDAFGFVGKVYDAKNKVGVVANPNLLSYTIDPGSSPGVDIPAGDLDGTYWGADQLRVASYSSVEFTNPFGGPSSMLMSGLSSWPDDGDGTITASGYGLCIATTNNSRIPLFPAASSTTYIASIFVKRPTDGYETSSCMMNLKDSTTPDEAYIAVWKFDGAVPSLSESDTGITTHEEDYGNGWWRLQVRVKGSDVTEDTAAGDRMNLYFYGGDNRSLGGGNYTPSSNWTGKTMYAYAPQMEVHPDAYDMSATPYQSVAGISPTVAEQQGEGGLHVSGGVDATNSGTVEYSMIVGSGDVGYSNLYGGIYNMGLWTIDMDESIKAGNTPPYSFGPLNNPRKYKLFATKHLTKNLGYIEDSALNPGSLNYKDLTIKWRLHFL